MTISQRIFFHLYLKSSSYLAFLKMICKSEKTFSGFMVFRMKIKLSLLCHRIDHVNGGLRGQQSPEHRVQRAIETSAHTHTLIALFRPLSSFLRDRDRSDLPFPPCWYLLRKASSRISCRAIGLQLSASFPLCCAAQCNIIVSTHQYCHSNCNQ